MPASYDLHQLRAPGLIHRIPYSHRYTGTDIGLRPVPHLLHDRFIRTGLAKLTDPDPPTPSRLRARHSILLPGHNLAHEDMGTMATFVAPRPKTGLAGHL